MIKPRLPEDTCKIMLKCLLVVPVITCFISASIVRHRFESRVLELLIAVAAGEVLAMFATTGIIWLTTTSQNEISISASNIHNRRCTYGGDNVGLRLEMHKRMLAGLLGGCLIALYVIAR